MIRKNSMKHHYLEKKYFYSNLNMVYGKAMENVRKNRDYKLVTIEKRRNYLVSEPSCHTI